MTELEWLACAEPERMLNFLLGRDLGVWYRFNRWLGMPEYPPGVESRKISDRKLRLFACACCFPLFKKIHDGRSIDALMCSYRFADNGVDDETLNIARSLAWQAVDALPNPSLYGTTLGFGSSAPYVWLARAAAETASENAADAAVNTLHAAMQAAIELGAAIHNPEAFVAGCGAKAVAAVLRDIAGNPFCPTTLDPAWATPTVTALATEVYDGNTWERLPDLRDALKEAGCTNPDLLGHCRSSRGHARGCWVVDAILGKS